MSSPAPGNPWDAGGTGWPLGDSAATGDSGAAAETVPDLSALVPEGGTDPWVSWGPTLEDLAQVYEWLYKKGSEWDVPGATMGYALLCAKGMEDADFEEVVNVLLRWLKGDDATVDLSDPCQILRTAKVGSCVVRRYLQISFAPDVLDFWLDGKAADPSNLQQEVFRFPPDERGIPTVVSFYPMDTAWFFGRVGTKVQDRLVEAQAASLWEGVRDRLREPVGTLFPKESTLSKGSVSPLREAVPLAPAASTLPATGVDWIYPKETTVVFKYAEQAPGTSQEIVDSELFPFGGMTVTSEVEVQAKQGTLRVGETDIDGWTVTVVAWRVRISDRWDYNAGASQGIPLPIDLKILDDNLLLLQQQGCAGAPTPTDFNIVSDAWHEVPRNLAHPSVFVSREAHAEGDAGSFGGTPTQFDFWDPNTGEGISLVNL